MEAVANGGGSAAEDPGIPSQEELAKRLAHPAIRAPLAIALTDAQGLIQWVNPAFTRQTGYQLTDVFGRERLALFKGSDATRDEVKRIRRAMSLGELVEAEFQTVTRDGEVYWVSCVVAPSDSDAGLESFVFAEEDITRRRMDENIARSAIHRVECLAEALKGERELLASVVATIPHIVFWKDTEGRYLGCNDGFLRFRGISATSELVGRTEAELSPKTELASVIERMEARVAETGEAVADESVDVIGPDGSCRTMLLSILPRYTEEREDGGIIGVGADVTRISELERQLAQATRLESIGQLAAGLAHEINTPVQYVSDNVLFLADSVREILQALGSIAELYTAETDEPSPRAEDVLASIKRLLDELDLEFLAAEIPGALEQSLEGVGRVAEIVRAMKEFSHPGQGRSATDINRAVETTVQVSRNEWKYVAELVVDLDPNMGLVPCYEGELKQVVLNLVVNAAHAIADRESDEPGRIELATRRNDTDVTISISDNGCGMDAATQRRVFDPFFTTKEVGKGTGQGLSMAHSSIVVRHGGSIEIISSPGAGSKFVIHLPLSDADSSSTDVSLASN